ncbi:alpha/beta-hydrolase [Xylariaceae sp. FL0255]|nr:alpha/beta-hydrolase [Xylariaceae sp. FL0255]
MGLFGKKRQDQSVSPCSPPLAKPIDRPSPPPPQGHLDPRYQHRPTPVQPAGYLPPPPSSSHAPQPPPYSWDNQPQRPCPPIIVNQHYYLNPPPPQHHAVPNSVYPSNGGRFALSNLKLGPEGDLFNLPLDVINYVVDDGLPKWHAYGSQLLNQGAAMYDQLSSKFNDVMTLIDREKYSGDENELFVYEAPPSPGQENVPLPPPRPSTSPTAKAPKSGQGKKQKLDASKGHTGRVATSLISNIYFAKVDLYANSKLPKDLPPLKVTIPTYPLLCLAAQYSERVYEKPRGAERDALVDADWRTGTKAMYIKSVPMDHMNTIVFAIRGTSSFMDWAVNLNSAPTAPIGFLDDPRNFCHAGFLSVARKMVSPVAARLRQLLEEDPGRSSYSLMFTGHSAGGAVASLLYMHMLATAKSTSSELNLLMGCFKRVHCITFGAPPVSLYPLQTPHSEARRKFLFYSFINEGDPVTRADKAYVRNLLELLAAPSPPVVRQKDSTKLLTAPPPKPSNNKPQEKKSKASLASKSSKAAMKSTQSLHSNVSKKSSRSSSDPPKPTWKVPPSTLSNAGKIIVLRSGNPHAKVKRSKTIEERLGEGVIAQVASDEKLRGLIWGDPVCHMMKLYVARIEVLAVAAVTAKGH